MLSDTLISNNKIRRVSISNNIPRRFSIISKNFDNEYNDNERKVEIINSELSEPLSNKDGITNRRRLTQIISIVDNDKEIIFKPKGYYLLLFIIEPIITSCFLFPLLVLFWDCGWNLSVTMLNSLNNYSLTYNLDGENYTDYDYGNYSPQSLCISYLIVQIILLILYIIQDKLYEFLKKQNSIFGIIVTNFHALLLASLYIVQWDTIWTILDQYTPVDWSFMMLFSLTSFFVLITITGTLSDFVCSPFVISYDSIEYCIQFECPLLIENVKQWKINLLNYILYEIIISIITIIGWHGFYTILDQYLYPDDINKSIWICLLIGYLLYFPLMYSQYNLNKLNIDNKYWIIFLSNFPQFHRNIVHLLSFTSCLFIWRGFWVLYDTYLHIFEKYYETYLLISLLLFIFLSLIQTFSSMNGPLKTMDDNYKFFPVYPHCYVSKVVYNLSQLTYFKSKKIDPTTNIFHMQNNNHNLNIY